MDSDRKAKSFKVLDLDVSLHEEVYYLDRSSSSYTVSDHRRIWLNNILLESNKKKSSV